MKLKKISQLLSEDGTEEFETLCRKDIEDKNIAQQISEILAHKIRSKKLAIKDIKMRTFIAEGSTRNDMAAHVYDITYNSITPKKDSIAVIDDSQVVNDTERAVVLHAATQ